MTLNLNNSFILTGAPGVGKTTLLKELEKTSIKCIPEPARIILAEQRSIQGDALPEKNSKLFCEMMLQRSIQDYDINQQSKELVIFDRGIPDNIAYAACFGLNTDIYFSKSKNYPYHKFIQNSDCV